MRLIAFVFLIAVAACTETAPPCGKSGLFVNREYANAGQVCL
jgi:hypothetical protein